MGLKAGEVVKSLVEDVIMPLVLKLIPGGSIENIADLSAY
ncbi:hypothetical protein KA405_04110 [Patescibacteria group bacterium]|nr:hypothetical protein [Patescibacteria group bacterium]